jgi:glycosyltransferase AglI
MSEDCLVSVIVPVYNDPNGIEITVQSLIRQKTPKDTYEIVVVDNNSSDSTGAVARELLADVPNGHVIDEREIQSSYAARNTGIEFSSGEILAFIDSDMSAPETWLVDLVDEFDRTGAEYIGCSVNLYCPLQEPTVMSKYDIAFGFPVEFYVDNQNFAPTCCLAVKRAVIEDVGPFDTRLTSGGDWEFGQRVARAGYDQHVVSEISLYHPTRTTLRDYVKKRLRVGAGQEQLYRRHGASAGGRPWYHPKNLLPPHPGNFKRRLSTAVAPKYLLFFYLISHFGKMVLLLGRLQWLVKERRRATTGLTT